MSAADHTCPRCHGMRMYRKCFHGCDGKTPEDVLRERRLRRVQKEQAKRSERVKQLAANLTAVSCEGDCGCAP